MVDKYVLDACALVAFIKQEPGFDIVRDIFIKASEGKAEISMNKLNLLEVHYGIQRVEGHAKTALVYEMILRLPILVNDCMRDDVFHEASRIKSSYRMSLADAIALGEASTMDATLITSDHHEFDIVEANENIKFKWIR